MKKHSKESTSSEPSVGLILPDENGVPNLEIKRHAKLIEQQRAHDRGVNPQTLQEIAVTLDRFRELAQQGEIRSLVLTAIMRQRPGQPSAQTVFACPREDRALAEETAQVTVHWLNTVLGDIPPPPSAG